MGFPGDSVVQNLPADAGDTVVQNLPADAGDTDSIPGPGRFHVEQNI